ncbi:MAG TPA: hypothetical protein VLT16_14055, partial [Candidatus Limnocylindrales bacterium]|nr:hypothetical protein [Candidatus Limnocylindrales bacterium]
GGLPGQHDSHFKAKFAGVSLLCQRSQLYVTGKLLIAKWSVAVGAVAAPEAALLGTSAPAPFTVAAAMAAPDLFHRLAGGLFAGSNALKP